MDASRGQDFLSFAASLPGARAGALDEIPATEQPTLTKKPPEGDAWLHEIKLDGYRMLCRVSAGEVTLESRRGQRFTAVFPHLVSAARALPARDLLLDGEVAVLAPDGRTNFGALQSAIGARDTRQSIFFAFDLLHIDGIHLCRAALEDRKRLLERLLPPGGPFRFTPHIVGQGPEVFAQACKLGLEGIVSKRRDAPYRGGRSKCWLKTKCVNHANLIVIGGTISAARPFGALLLGHYDEGGRLVYAGRVGSGFSEKDLSSLGNVLDKLETEECPLFGARPGPARHVRWAAPLLVVEVKFTEWTNDGLLRHPTFLRARPDLDARTIGRIKAR